MRKFTSKFNIFLTILLLVGVTFSVITIVNAVTPNPGHSWSETGDGVFAVTGPTTLRTYTFPDSNASIAILGANTFTAGQNIVDASSAQLRLTRTASTIYSEFKTDGAGDLLISTTSTSGVAGTNHVRINDGNIWICSGGSCATSGVTPTTNGNIIVENALILENKFKLKQTSSTTVDMLDSGDNIILQFDEAS